MIVYFANRQLKVIGQASEKQLQAITITDDLKTEDIETGTTVFSFVLYYKDAEERARVEDMSQVGNYVFRHDEKQNKNECYIITEQEATTDKTISIYAEDAGLDFINEIAIPYPDTQQGDDENPHPLNFYVNKWIEYSGYEIGTDEIGTTKQIAYENDSEQTVTERLLDVTKAFDAEFDFSFVIEGLEVKKRYINLYKSRGSDKGVKLWLGKEIKSITKKSSLYNLATALFPHGAVPAGAQAAINLVGYNYNDGEFYVDTSTGLLISIKARDKWGSEEDNAMKGNIIKTFEKDTLDQADLCSSSIAELKKMIEPEVTYEIEIEYLPDNVCIGDVVEVRDSESEMIIKTRITKIEISICGSTVQATAEEVK